MEAWITYPNVFSLSTGASSCDSRMTLGGASENTNRHFVYFVGQSGWLKVKGGCVAAPTTQLAHVTLTTRYQTYYPDLIIYGIVPVAQHKRMAESQLFQLAASFADHHEFFQFDDELLLVNCVHQFLETMRVPEEAAYTSIATKTTLAEREARKRKNRQLERDRQRRHEERVAAKHMKAEQDVERIAIKQRTAADTLDDFVAKNCTLQSDGWICEAEFNLRAPSVHGGVKPILARQFVRCRVRINGKQKWGWKGLTWRPLP